MSRKSDLYANQFKDNNSSLIKAGSEIKPSNEQHNIRAPCEGKGEKEKVSQC